MKRTLRIALMAFLAAFASSQMTFAVADDQIEAAASAAECEARGAADGIRLSAAERTNFEIYSITGQRIKAVAVEATSVKVELPKGCYIVRCPQWSKKVIVK